MSTWAYFVTIVTSTFLILPSTNNHLVSAHQHDNKEANINRRGAIRRAQSTQGNTLFTNYGNATEQMAAIESTWEPPLCGDCWCIPSSGSKCPKGKIPKYEFTAKEISFFQSLTLTSGDLTCFPAKPAPWIPDGYWPVLGSVCDVADFTAGPNAVCAFLYDTPKSKKSCPVSYSLQTFETAKLAKAADAFVTHKGPCGMCSNAKDLAVYMTKPDLTTEVTACIQNPAPPQVILQCLMQNVGFTQGCALVYLEDYISTNFYTNSQGVRCPILCQVTVPPNGLPPECTLNSCLACNEEASKAAGISGSLPSDFFTTYAGRTRRNSGLLSNIVRECNSIATDVKQKYCPT
jgi:hypothetical protein